MNTQIDFYIRLKSEKNQKTKTQFSTKLTTPLLLPYNHKWKVGLASLHFVNNTNEINVRSAKFEIAISRFTVPKTSKSPTSEPEKNKIEQSSLKKTKKRRLSFDSTASNSRDEPIHRGFFLESLEDGYYTADTLCESLNYEIQSKFNSNFKKKACRFYFDHSINRFQLQVAGSDDIPALDKTTLVLYQPLSRLLGFTLSHAASESFIFGAPRAPFLTSHAIKHAVAAHPPQIARSNFFYIYLNCIQKQFVEGTFRELIAIVPRRRIDKTTLISHYPNPVLYYAVSPYVDIIRELTITIENEYGDDIEFLDGCELRLCLHFCSERR